VLSTVQVQDYAEDGVLVMRASNLSIVAGTAVAVADSDDDGLRVTDGAALRIMDSTVRVENRGAAGPSQLGMIVFLRQHGVLRAVSRYRASQRQHRRYRGHELESLTGQSYAGEHE